MLGVDFADIKRARAKIRAILRAVPRMPAARKKSLTLSFQNVFETFVISWPTVVDAVLGRVSMEECDARLSSWAAEIAKNAAYELEVVGREHLGDHGEAFLVMSNHQSLYDVPVLFHVLGANLRMITKSELFKVPIFGPAMKASGFIEIDRSNRTRALESLALAKAKIAGGLNVWIAPEGTRSRDGRLLSFKKGGFNLALEAGLRVLPVTLKGTRDILTAKGTRSVSHAHVRVTIHAPIDASEYAKAGLKEGREALMTAVRDALESGL
jgi:1-acyl-sn-glycerol-3-phosphate acyltransferase